MAKIVITGAAGFVGANLARHFLAQGHEVTALTGGNHGDWRLPKEAQGLKKLFVDLCDEAALRALISKTAPEAWINCAAYGAYPSQTDAPLIYRTCFDSVRWTLEELRKLSGFKAFVQMGSQSEYGFNCSAPQESSGTVPDSDYAVAKVAATAATQFYGKKHGVPAWAFRLYSVYGPYEETSRLIPKLLLQIRAGKLPPLASRSISRDFVHVDDVSRAVEAVLTLADRLPKGEVYNIGTGVCTTLEKLVETARSAFGVKAEASWGSMPDRKWDHAGWYSDSAKAERDLGWKARLAVREGLEKTMAWIEANPEAIQLGLRHSVV